MPFKLIAKTNICTGTKRRLKEMSGKVRKPFQERERQRTKLTYHKIRIPIPHKSDYLRKT